ncbi:MAG TPA: glutamate--tRNA ligase, partial [Cyclobacteriaceae bacterium]|nr:glutamate--tRNA ligase [Cyclobacteriaceae bacterium]
TEYDQHVTSKKWNDDAIRVLTAYKQTLSSIKELTAEMAKTTLEDVTTSLGISTGKILQALRVSITGAGSGPDLMLSMEIMGSEEVVSRIDRALSTLKKV